MPDSPRKRVNWWFVFIGLLMLVLALLTLSKCHTLVETSIEINATPEQVWSVLTNFETYPEWNPFIKQISGTPEAGQTLSVTIEPPGGKSQHFTPRVLSAEPGHELRWLGQVGMARVFDGRHYFVIDTEGQPDGWVKFVHGESFEGLLVPFMAKQLDTKVRQGFEAMNQALAERIKVAYPALLPGSAAGFLYAPPGAVIYRLQPSMIERGAAGTAGYTSSIAYFTSGSESEVNLDGLGDQLIQAGFDLEHSETTVLGSRTDYYILPDGSLEVLLGHFTTIKQLADTMSAVGRPIFPEGFPAEFLVGDSYTGYRIELREFSRETASTFHADSPTAANAERAPLGEPAAGDDGDEADAGADETRTP